MTHQEVYTLVKALSYTLAVVSAADVLRFMSRRIERRYESLLGFLMRESEKVGPSTIKLGALQDPLRFDLIHFAVH